MTQARARRLDERNGYFHVSGDGYHQQLIKRDLSSLDRRIVWRIRLC